MTLARKFLGLSGKDQGFLIGTLLLVVIIRLSLWVLPFALLRRILALLTPTTALLPQTSFSSVSRTIWAITVTSRYVPAATCLTQALAAQVLLAQQGYATGLRIGVAKDQNEKLKAHAWLESQEQIIIGGADSPHHFTPLPSLEGKW